MKAKCVPKLNSEQIARFWAKVQKRRKTACWVWTGRMGDNGYGLFKVGKRMMSAHRVAYALGKNKQPGELHVLHECDHKPCCNPDHLFLGTNQDNCDDYVAKGLSINCGHNQVGKRNGNVRLTENDVRAIRRSDDVQRIIAARHGITQVMVSRIKLRRAWKHL